ncbi:amidohydrolase family protein [Streptomyces pseudovenezuelae]|uniref:Imidazolonepropionase-like amidohydrolase n=1 Tax=Streptomyces pseudovenezuelae TaxID=67350 RepID=A0ABT6LNU2_9ACTN|nr:amidohydrolase family protein [Streptomyces pseudovenezuelae]MDH6217982.1 imidazolonepropionase-like amidohydrolase [Streptomyces pseudovenezuelae]
MGHEVLGAPTPWAPPAAGAAVVYRGATVIDGTGGPARTATSIVTDGATIRAVVPDAEIADSTARVVDLTGRFVVPGLIDSHQHIATPPDRATAEAMLRRQVHGGVTAIRVMADDLRQVAELARAALVGEIPGPDIQFAALMAGPTFFDDPRTQQVSQGGTPGAVPWMQAITDETDLPLAVAMARGTGARAVKIYADLPADTVAALTAEAHRQGLAVWAHGTVYPASPGDVVDAGVDTVSHATALAQEGTRHPLTTYKDKPPIEYDRFADGDDPHLQALFERMLAQGTILDATSGMWANYFAPEATDPESQERVRANSRLAAGITNHAYRVGVPISAGGDYENAPEHPFPALHDEMVFLARECGIPPVQVIRSATLVGAMSMGAQDVMGTVEEGKLANFAVLSGNPLADIAHLADIEFVVKRGCRYDRSDYQPAAPGR